MNVSEKELIILTPVFEDADSCRQLLRELKTELSDPFSVVIVDDGSIRRPFSDRDLEELGVAGRVIRLPRNVGHQGAIAFGLGRIAEWIQDVQTIIVMDCDGEDRPADILALLETLVSDEVDVAVAARRRRSESLRFRLFYFFYKWIFRAATGRSIDFGNFMAMRAISVRRLAQQPELTLHVAAAALKSKLRISKCPLDRGKRYCGESKMNFLGLVLHGFRALMVFAEDVLVRVGLACIVVASMAVTAAVTALGLKLLGYATPGWFSTVVGILILVVIQTGALTLMLLMLTGVLRNSLTEAPTGSWDRPLDTEGQ